MTLASPYNRSAIGTVAQPVPNEMTIVLPFMAAEKNGRFFAPSVRCVDLLNRGDLSNEQVTKEIAALAYRVISNHPHFSKSMAYTGNFSYNGQKTIYTSDKISGGLVSTLMQEVVLDMLIHDTFRVDVAVMFETAGYVRN